MSHSVHISFTVKQKSKPKVENILTVLKKEFPKLTLTEDNISVSSRSSAEERGLIREARREAIEVARGIKLPSNVDVNREWAKLKTDIKKKRQLAKNQRPTRKN